MHRLRVLLLAVGVAACVESGDESIVILQNQAPGPGCVVSASDSAAYIGAGVIDARSASGYVLTPVAENFSAATGDSVRQRTAFVRGIRVDLSIPVRDGGPITADEVTALRAADLLRFEVAYAARIEPGGTTSMQFEIVPRELLERLGETISGDDSVLVLADLRLVGVYGDGSTFTGTVFRYPVEVCEGCLANDLGACTSITRDDVVNVGGHCNPAQDLAVDCCSSGEALVCPAVPEGSS
jgi:hypothetical protein